MRNVKEHNKEMIYTARNRSEEMKIWPSPLEEKMKMYLDTHSIYYEQQKIFYIYDEDGWIKRYFIADFFLPNDNLIVEVDGKFHDKHKQADRDRTKLIQTHYPGVEVMRFTWKDLSDKGKMKKLLNRVYSFI